MLVTCIIIALTALAIYILIVIPVTRYWREADQQEYENTTGSQLIDEEMQNYPLHELLNSNDKKWLARHIKMSRTRK